MQVETFECVETAAEPIEACEEAISLIERLGIDGQRELLKPRADGDQPSRCPYRHMRPEEQIVYGLLCPERVPLKRYRASPIPLRVLQIAAHAMETGVIKSLWVWDKASIQTKDPVLVGSTSEGGYEDWNSKRFVLARWGETLESWPTLVAQAMQAAKDRLASLASGLSLESLIRDDEVRKVFNIEVR